MARTLAWAVAATIIAATAMVPNASARDFGGDGFDWNGFHAGVHGGWGDADVDWTFNNSSYFNTTAGETIDHGADGVFRGGQIGYNHMMGSWLVGIELTYSAADLSARGVSPFFPEDLLFSDIDEIMTVAARLCYATGPWLWYVKAGYGGANVILEANDTTTPITDQYISTSWHDGLVLGVGVETAVAGTCILGAEYNYLDLGSDAHDASDNITPAPVEVDADVEVQSIVARSSYKLGRGAPAMEPLK